MEYPTLAVTKEWAQTRAMTKERAQTRAVTKERAQEIKLFDLLVNFLNNFYPILSTFH